MTKIRTIKPLKTPTPLHGPTPLHVSANALSKLRQYDCSVYLFLVHWTVPDLRISVY